VLLLSLQTQLLKLARIFQMEGLLVDVMALTENELCPKLKLAGIRLYY